MRSMRIAELNRELEAGLPLGPDGQGPRARLPVRLLAQVFWADWCGNVPEML